MNRATTCCFSGHRPHKLPWGNREDDPRCLALKEAISVELKLAYDRGYRHFICGMALGCDFYFTESALVLRDAWPDVTVEAAVPCPEQATRWTQTERERYVNLLKQCDIETLIQPFYSNGCMQRRNRYMVNRSSLLMAVYDGKPGSGTMNTIKCAMDEGVETLLIDWIEEE